MGRNPVYSGTNPAPGRVLRNEAISPFVGRDEELRRLAEALSLAANGDGGIFLVTGQHGIGKTRLASEALALARRAGFVVLQGRAHPLGADLAYAPILDAFGPLLRSLDPNRLGALALGLPDLRRLFSDLRLHGPGLPLEGLGDPAFEKTRLFESVSRLLERLTRETPVVLFIDDLQLADSASLEMLYYLARGLPGHRAVMIATYTSDSPDISHSLRTLVGSVRQDWPGREIVLERLRPDAVEKLIKGILGGNVPSEMLPLLDARAGGTPLYVEALVHALIDSGNLVRSSHLKEGWAFNAEGATALSPSVRHLILDRLERLGLADRQVLDQIAILGNATSYAILREASGLEENTLVEALRRLLASGLVGEGTDGSDVTYTIVHPLVQEVAYAEQPEIVRRRAHLAAIEALESLLERRPGDESRLARHYSAAGSEANRERAFPTLLAAGDRALAVYANDEAERHYANALAILRRDRGPGNAEESRTASNSYSPMPDDPLPHLLERLGEAYERTGKLHMAVDMWNEALVRRGRAGDAVTAVRLRGQLAVAEWKRGQLDAANTHLGAGLDTASGLEPCQELADLLYARIRIPSRLGDAPNLANTAAELSRVAHRLRSPRAEAEASLAATLSFLLQGDVLSARDRALHALTVGERAQELAVCCRASKWLVTVGMYLGDHRFIRYHAERGLAAARRLNTPNLEIVLRLHLAHASFLAGDWAEALEQGSECLILARRLGHPRDLIRSLAQQAIMLALRGDLPEAESCISEARTVEVEVQADREASGLIDVAETTLALERGQVDEALAIAQVFNQPSAYAMAPDMLLLPYWPMALILLAEAQVVAGEAESALETARRIRSLGAPDAPYLTALSARSEGLARQALGQAQESHACLTGAQQTFAALRMPFESARTLLDRALPMAPNHGKAVARDVQQCLVTFERLGVRRYAEQARRFLSYLGVSPAPTLRRRLSGVLLSEREFEVARLVAGGLTTAEIAERLILSQHTVATHLHHIYSRLGIGSRTALARQVIESGLL